MAIVPQRRISKTRKRQRRSHQALDLPGMMVCPECGEVKLNHAVCRACGYYDGKKVKEIKVSGEEVVEAVKDAKEEKAEKKAAKKTAKATKKEEK